MKQPSQKRFLFLFSAAEDEFLISPKGCSLPSSVPTSSQKGKGKKGFKFSVQEESELKGANRRVQHRISLVTYPFYCQPPFQVFIAFPICFRRCFL